MTGVPRSEPDPPRVQCDECGLRVAIQQVGGRRLCGPCTGKAAAAEKNRGALRLIALHTEDMAEFVADAIEMHATTEAPNSLHRRSLLDAERQLREPTDALGIVRSLIPDLPPDALEQVRVDAEIHLRRRAANMCRACGRPQGARHTTTCSIGAGTGPVGPQDCTDAAARSLLDHMTSYSRRGEGPPLDALVAAARSGDRESFAAFYDLDPETLHTLPPAKPELASELREIADRAASAAASKPGPLAAAPHRALARTAEAMAEAAERESESESEHVHDFESGEQVYDRSDAMPRVPVYIECACGARMIPAARTDSGKPEITEVPRAADLSPDALEQVRVDAEAHLRRRAENTQGTCGHCGKMAWEHPHSTCSVFTASSEPNSELASELRGIADRAASAAAKPGPLAKTEGIGDYILLNREQREAVAQALSLVERFKRVWEYYGNINIEECARVLRTIRKD